MNANHLLASDSNRSDVVVSLTRAVSSDSHNCLNGVIGEATTHIVNSVLKDQANRITKTLLRRSNGLSLPICAGHFRANRPVAAFRRFFNNRGELAFHERDNADESDAVNRAIAPCVISF